MHNQNTFVHTLRNHRQSHCDQLSFATFSQQIFIHWSAIVYDLLTEIFRIMISKWCTDCLDYPKIFKAECIRHVQKCLKKRFKNPGVNQKPDKDFDTQSLLLYLLSYSAFDRDGSRTHDPQIIRHLTTYSSEYNHYCTMELYWNSQLWTCTDRKATSSTHYCDIFL